jgi:hypothetical protein
MWRASTGVYFVFDQIPNYKIAFPPQTKTLEGRELQTEKYLPPNPFTGQFFRKDNL